MDSQLQMNMNVSEKLDFVIVGISQAETEGGYVVLLESDQALKRIPIHIGVSEGQAIALALEAFEAPRPLTHHLIMNFIRDTKAELEGISIDRLFEGVFFAKIKVKTEEGKSVALDARPSDALVLAILANCPIQVAPEIVEMVGMHVEKEEGFEEYRKEEELEFYGMSVEDLEKELHKVIQREEYESASKIRDRINFLKNKKNAGK